MFKQRDNWRLIEIDDHNWLWSLINYYSIFFISQHANKVRNAAEDYIVRRQARQKSLTRSMTTGLAGPILSMGVVHYLPAAKSGTFFARDNVSNFIAWCRWVAINHDLLVQLVLKSAQVIAL